MTDPITPDERATIRRGYLGRPLACAANDAMRLLDALDAAEAEIERLRAKVEWQVHWIASLDASRRAVLEHLPARPDREAVRLAQHRALMPQAMSIFAAVGGTQADYDALLDTLADAVLALWPCESRATVQAEAPRAFAASLEVEEASISDAEDFERHRDSYTGRINGLRAAARLAHARADRLEKGEPR